MDRHIQLIVRLSNDWAAIALQDVRGQRRVPCADVEELFGDQLARDMPVWQKAPQIQYSYRWQWPRALVDAARRAQSPNETISRQRRVDNEAKRQGVGHGECPHRDDRPRA